MNWTNTSLIIYIYIYIYEILALRGHWSTTALAVPDFFFLCIYTGYNHGYHVPKSIIISLRLSGENNISTSPRSIYIYIIRTRNRYMKLNRAMVYAYFDL